MKLSTIFISLLLIVFPLSNNPLDNQDLIDTLKLCESLHLKLCDTRFTIKFIRDLPKDAFRLSATEIYIPRDPRLLPCKNDDIFYVPVNDWEYNKIIWFSMDIDRTILETDNILNYSNRFFVLLPSDQNSFYIIMETIINKELFVRLLKVTGPFEVAASIPDFNVFK